MEKEIEKELGSWELELGSLSLFWKERNLWIFDSKSSSLKDFKLYFLRLLYS